MESVGGDVDMKDEDYYKAHPRKPYDINDADWRFWTIVAACIVVQLYVLLDIII